MIAPVKRESSSCARLQKQFLKMLPQSRQCACFAFRAIPTESRDDLVAEVVANSFCAFASLASQGKEHVASTASRVSQLRAQLKASWEQLQGVAPPQRHPCADAK